MRDFRYLTNCTELSRDDVGDLWAMQDEAVEITWETLLRHVLLAQVMALFPWYFEHGSLHIKDDWAVGFYRSEFRGQRVYYIQHSCIEYIFTRRK